MKSNPHQVLRCVHNFQQKQEYSRHIPSFIVHNFSKMTNCLIFIKIQNKSFWQELYYKLLALILSLLGHARYTGLPETTLMLHARQMVLNGQVTPMSTVRYFFLRIFSGTCREKTEAFFHNIPHSLCPFLCWLSFLSPFLTFLH